MIRLTSLGLGVTRKYEKRLLRLYNSRAMPYTGKCGARGAGHLLPARSPGKSKTGMFDGAWALRRWWLAWGGAYQKERPVVHM